MDQLQPAKKKGSQIITFAGGVLSPISKYSFG